MAIYKILGENDPILRQKAKIIPNITPNVAKLLDNLKDTLRDNGNGVGLAAPQIGVSKRALVIIIPPKSETEGETEETTEGEKESGTISEINEIEDCVAEENKYATGAETDEEQVYELINPELVEREGMVRDNEGCLSLPDIIGEVDRYNRVRVIGLDRNGMQVEYLAEGFLARAFQHEIDHLNGILFVDRAISVKPLEKEK